MKKSEDTNTGYPSIDRPWLKYYSKESQKALEKEKLPAPDCGIYEFLRGCNQAYLKYTALNYFGTKITYKKMFENIDLVAQKLWKDGVTKGEVISVCALNIPEVFYLLYAINKVGAVSNWLGLTSPVADLHEQISATESKVIFSVEPALDQIVKSAKGTRVEKIIVLPIENSMPKWMKMAVVFKKTIKKKEKESNAEKNIEEEAGDGMEESEIRKTPDNRKDLPPEVISWRDFLQGSKKGLHAQPQVRDGQNTIRGKDIALIEYTGGSTGVPKGVMLSNMNLNSHYVNFLKANSAGLSNYQRGEKYLGCVPIFLGFGIVAGGNAPLCHSMELVLAPDPNPKTVVKLIWKTKTNHIIGGRLLVDEIVRKAEHTHKELTYIYSVLYGGEGVDRSWEKKVEEKLQMYHMTAPVLNGYGMTETSSGALITMPAETRCLIPLPNVDAMIVDPDDHHTELGYDTEGELCLSADTVMLGYYKNAAATEEVLFEVGGKKWIKTHDLAEISPDGTITITGRIKRIYHKLSPDNVEVRVYPMRTEEVIARDPDVERCAVVGIKDDKTAYRTVAYLKLRGGDAVNTLNVVNSAKTGSAVVDSTDTSHRCDIVRERIDRLCRENLPKSHVPDEYAFVEEFPLTRAGKVDYRELEKRKR